MGQLCAHMFLSNNWPMHCSLVVMGISIEEVQPQKKPMSDRQILEGLTNGTISTTVSRLGFLASYVTAPLVCI